MSPAPVTWPTWVLPPPLPQPHPPSRRRATALPGLQPLSNGRGAGHAEQAAAPWPRPRPVPGPRFPSRALPPLNATRGGRTAALATVIPPPLRPPCSPPSLPSPSRSLRPRQPGACARARVCARPARTRACRRVPAARCRNMAGSVADSDAVVVSAAAARKAGSLAGRGRGLPTRGAAGGAVPVCRCRVGAPGPGARGGRARARCAPGACACTCVTVGPRPRRPGISPFGTSPALGAPESSGELSQHSSHVQPRPPRTGLGAEVPAAFVLEEGPAAHLHGLCFPRRAATLNLIRFEDSGDHQRLRPGGKAGCCFAVI